MIALAAALLVTSCGASVGPVARGISPSPSASPVAARTPSPPPPTSPAPDAAASPAPTPPMPTPPMPIVSCVQGTVPTFQAVVQGSSWLLYDVGDPLHPRLACRIANTPVHLIAGTSFEYVVPNRDGTTTVMRHSLGSNSETVAATVQADLYHVYTGWYGGVAWMPGGGRLAYLAGGGTDAQGLGVTDVWLATPTGRTRIYSYSVPGKDAFGRPGFAPITLDFSRDGAYLAAGWYVATTRPRVFRLTDHADVSPQLPTDFRFAFWSKTQDTLYMVGGSGVETWSPGGPVTPLQGTAAWTLGPSLAPDGKQVVFTIVTPTRDVRTYVYDFASASSRLLSDQPRSSALFVKSGWVWQVEEKPCVQSSTTSCFDPTVPDGRVLAVDLSTGREEAVTFAPGESATDYGMLPGDLWPKT